MIKMWDIFQKKKGKTTVSMINSEIIRSGYLLHDYPVYSFGTGRRGEGACVPGTCTEL